MASHHPAPQSPQPTPGKLATNRQSDGEPAVMVTSWHFRRSSGAPLLVINEHAFTPVTRSISNSLRRQLDDNWMVVFSVRAMRRSLHGYGPLRPDLKGLAVLCRYAFPDSETAERFWEDYKREVLGDTP